MHYSIDWIQNLIGFLIWFLSVLPWPLKSNVPKICSESFRRPLCWHYTIKFWDKHWQFCPCSHEGEFRIATEILKACQQNLLFYDGSNDVVCKYLKMKMKTEWVNLNDGVVINYANKCGEWKQSYYFIPWHYSNINGIKSALVGTADNMYKTCFV